jgi:NAD(P)-dependent dehydrogenase (short-subunit alcohol dehydrogenase family)
MTDNNTAPLASTIAWHCVLITGASAGIGRALALACAEGGITLHLGGRDAARLESVAEMCRAKGAAVVTRIVDVRDRDAMAAWIGGVGRLDLVVANAGIGAGSEDGRPEPAAQVRAVLATNLDGALNTILPALELMAAQQPDASGLRGRIAAIASIAAFVPGPGAATYCAAKAALDRWTIATAPLAASQGIQLSSICPGYVRTPMTAKNRFPMPGLMDADRAAAIMLRGIARGDRRVTFPWWLAAAAHLLGALPPRVCTWLLSRPPGKAPISGGRPAG